MNKKLNWLIYLIVVASTVGFAFYQYKQSQKTASEEEKQDRVFPSLTIKEVKSISLRHKEVYIYIVRAEEKGWLMELPLQDIADGDSVGQWIESILSEKVRVISKEDKKGKGDSAEGLSLAQKAEYGLDKDIKTVEIKTKAGDIFKINVSHYSAFDGRFYLQKGKHILLGETAWAGLTDKKAEDFRSYKLINEGKRPTQMNYRSSVFTTNLLWENYKWQWPSTKQTKEAKVKNPFPLSQSQLESYWTALSNIRMEQNTYPNTKKFREQFNLNSPILNIDLKFDNPWSVKVSESEGKFYILPSDRNYIFVLNEQQKKQMLLSKKDIRDHRQPFQFKKSEVKFIELKGQGIEATLKRKKQKWALQKPQKETNTETNKESKIEAKIETNTEANIEANKESKIEAKIETNTEVNKQINKELNTDEPDNILNRLATFSATEYFGKDKVFEKNSYVVLKDKENKNLLRLDFSAPFGEKNKKVYVLSNLGQEVMAIDSENIKAVFSPSLFREVKAPTIDTNPSEKNNTPKDKPSNINPSEKSNTPKDKPL